MREVILCDETGKLQGTCEIFAAHEHGGQLHRAFSVCVFRHNLKELLIQKRSAQKPVFPNLWANTCCSHPLPGEDVIIAGERRLREELGFTVPLQEATSFVYRADDPVTGLTEHEYDTVLFGKIMDDVAVAPDPAEVADYKWQNVADIQKELKERPEKFGPWFQQALAIALEGK